MNCALNAWKICGAKEEAKSRAGFWWRYPLLKKSSSFFFHVKPQVLLLASMGAPSPRDPGAWDRRIEGQVQESLSKSRRMRLAGGLFLSLPRVKTERLQSHGWWHKFRAVSRATSLDIQTQDPRGWKGLGRFTEGRKRN